MFDEGWDDVPVTLPWDSLEPVVSGSPMLAPNWLRIIVKIIDAILKVWGFVLGSFAVTILWISGFWVEEGNMIT